MLLLGLANKLGPQPGSYGPPMAVSLVAELRTMTAFSFKEEPGRKNGNARWEQPFFWLTRSIHPGWRDRDLQSRRVTSPPFRSLDSLRSTELRQTPSRPRGMAAGPSSPPPGPPPSAPSIPTSDGCWLPSGGQEFQQVSSGLGRCKTALREPPAGAAPGGTAYAFLLQGSPAQALQTLHGQLSFTRRGQLQHPTFPQAPSRPPPLTPPATFPLGKHCFHPPGTQGSCPWVQQKQPDLFPACGGRRRLPRGTRRGELLAPRRGNEPRSYEKRPIQQEASLAPARLQAGRTAAPPPWSQQTWGGKSCEMREEELGWRLPGNFNSALDELPALCFCRGVQSANDKMSGSLQACGVHLSVHPSIAGACSWCRAWGALQGDGCPPAESPNATPG